MVREAILMHENVNISKTVVMLHKVSEVDHRLVAFVLRRMPKSIRVISSINIAVEVRKVS